MRTNLKTIYTTLLFLLSIQMVFAQKTTVTLDDVKYIEENKALKFSLKIPPLTSSSTFLPSQGGNKEHVHALSIAISHLGKILKTYCLHAKPDVNHIKCAIWASAVYLSRLIQSKRKSNELHGLFAIDNDKINLGLINDILKNQPKDEKSAEAENPTLGEKFPPFPRRIPQKTKNTYQMKSRKKKPILTDLKVTIECHSTQQITTTPHEICDTPITLSCQLTATVSENSPAELLIDVTFPRENLDHESENNTSLKPMISDGITSTPQYAAKKRQYDQTFPSQERNSEEKIKTCAEEVTRKKRRTSVTLSDNTHYKQVAEEEKKIYVESNLLKKCPQIAQAIALYDFPKKYREVKDFKPEDTTNFLPLYAKNNREFQLYNSKGEGKLPMYYFIKKSTDPANYFLIPIDKSLENYYFMIINACNEQITFRRYNQPEIEYVDYIRPLGAHFYHYSKGELTPLAETSFLEQRRKKQQPNTTLEIFMSPMPNVSSMN